MLPSLASEIEAILTQFLQRCDIVYPQDVGLDSSYREACYHEAKLRGFDLAILGKSLDVGIAIGGTAYRHLQNRSTQIFVAIWSALAAHIDDSYELYAEGLGDFVDRFLAHEPQRFEALDYFASVVREVPKHWRLISSNLITTTGMDFLTSTIIEGEAKQMEVSDPRTLALLCSLIRIIDLHLQGSWVPPVYAKNDRDFARLHHHDIPTRVEFQNMDTSCS